MCLSYTNDYFTTTPPPLRRGAKEKYWPYCLRSKYTCRSERKERRSIELERQQWKRLARHIAMEYLKLHIEESEASTTQASSPDSCESVKLSPDSLTETRRSVHFAIPCVSYDATESPK